MTRAETSQSNAAVDEPEESAGGRQRHQRVPTLKTLPTERFGWDVHLAVLKNTVFRSRFGEQAIGWEQIEDGLRSQAASLSVSFLTDSGFLVKEKRKYRPTPECVSFVRLHSVDENRARAVFREIVQKTWFAATATNYLQLHGTVGEEALIREFAVAAGVADLQSKERAFRILVDYLAFAGILERDGKQLKLGRSDQQIQLPQLQAPPPTQIDPNSSRPPSSWPSGSAAGGPQRLESNAAPLAENAVHRNWPGTYDLWVVPDERALRLLESAIRELRAALEIQGERKS